MVLANIVWIYHTDKNNVYGGILSLSCPEHIGYIMNW